MSDDVTRWHRTARYLEAEGLYDPADERGSCGVGMIAAIDGKPSRDVVLKGIEALRAVWHRGAVVADGKTGDGAVIHIQIPQEFFKEHFMVKNIKLQPKIPEACPSSLHVQRY